MHWIRSSSWCRGALKDMLKVWISESFPFSFGTLFVNAFLDRICKNIVCNQIISSASKFESCACRMYYFLPYVFSGCLFFFIDNTFGICRPTSELLTTFVWHAFASVGCGIRKINKGKLDATLFLFPSI